MLADLVTALPSSSALHTVAMSATWCSPNEGVVSWVIRRTTGTWCPTVRFLGPGEWRNWQTRRIQVPVIARSWGFKSPLAHQEFRPCLA